MCWWKVLYCFFSPLSFFALPPFLLLYSVSSNGDVHKLHYSSEEKTCYCVFFSLGKISHASRHSNNEFFPAKLNFIAENINKIPLAFGHLFKKLTFYLTFVTSFESFFLLIWKSVQIFERQKFFPKFSSFWSWLSLDYFLRVRKYVSMEPFPCFYFQENRNICFSSTCVGRENFLACIIYQSFNVLAITFPSTFLVKFSVFFFGARISSEKKNNLHNTQSLCFFVFYFPTVYVDV